MTNKIQKNGFTLIELLAVIIIIAVIAVITIPIVNDNLEESRRNIAKESAYGYKKAVSELYYQKQMNKENVNLNGKYTVDETGKLTGMTEEYQLDFSGSKPKEGTLHYVDGDLKNGCLTINKYSLFFENGQVTNIEKGTCSELYEDSVYTIVSGTGTNIGDKICVDSECFYVVANNGETVSTLAEYNLYVGDICRNYYTVDREYTPIPTSDPKYGLQNKNAKGFIEDAVIYDDINVVGLAQFADSVYWSNASTPTYVYNSSSSISAYLEEYLEKLKHNGVSNNVEIRLLKLEEAEVFGCDGDAEHEPNEAVPVTCPTGNEPNSFITNSTFWLGTAVQNSYVYDVVTTGRVLNLSPTDKAFAGVRPVLDIPIDELIPTSEGE